MFDWLHLEFEKRKAKNPSYSLRAFSRDLGLSSGRLSEVLRGKRFLGPTTVFRVANRLDYSSQQIKDLVEKLKRERQSQKLFAYLAAAEKQVDETEILILSSEQSEDEMKKQEEALLQLIQKLKTSKDRITIQAKVFKVK